MSLPAYALGEALDVIRFLRSGWEPVAWSDGRLRWGRKQTDRSICAPTHTEWRDVSLGERSVLSVTGGLPKPYRSPEK